MYADKIVGARCYVLVKKFNFGNCVWAEHIVSMLEIDFEIVSGANRVLCHIVTLRVNQHWTEQRRCHQQIAL